MGRAATSHIASIIALFALNGHINSGGMRAGGRLLAHFCLSIFSEAVEGTDVIDRMYKYKAKLSNADTNWKCADRVRRSTKKEKKNVDSDVRKTVR